VDFKDNTFTVLTPPAGSTLNGYVPGKYEGNDATYVIPIIAIQISGEVVLTYKRDKNGDIFANSVSYTDQSGVAITGINLKIKINPDGTITNSSIPQEGVGRQTFVDPVTGIRSLVG